MASQTTSASGSTQHSNVQYILVMGGTGAGKSSFINEVSGSDLKVSDDIESCTADVQVSRVFTRDGSRRLALIDTPGFDDTNKPDAQVLAETALWLGKSFVKKEEIIGIIYLQSLENVRAGGTVVRNIEMFRQAVGYRAAENVVIATTKWDLIKEDIAEQRHKRLSEEDKFFRGLQQQGARIMESRTGSRSKVVDAILSNETVLPLHIQNEIAVEHKKVRKTDAGQVLEQDIKRGHDDWLRKNEEQMRQLNVEGSSWTTDEIKAMKKEFKSAQKEKKKEVKAKQKAMGQKLGGGGFFSFLTGN